MFYIFIFNKNMIRLITFLTFLQWQFHLICTQNNTTEINLEIRKKCRARNRLIATEKGDLYTVIDAPLLQKLILQCHYCNENDDARPKNWFKIDKLGITEPHAVKLSMENDNKLNRIHVNQEHSLVIDNFTESDAGLYFCIGYEELNKDEKHNYLVDIAFEENVTATIEKGNITEWVKYYNDYFAPINTLFKESQGTDFVHIREKLQLKMELITSWDPWGICEICGRRQGEGIRRKKGYCRIKLSPNFNLTVDNEIDMYLLKASAISCRSMTLNKKYPGLSNLTRVVPDFIQISKCDGVCNPDAEGANRGWKAGKTKEYKYRKIVVLKWGDHFTLVCPESTLENIVVWKKGGKVLKPGRAYMEKGSEGDPRILVDTFSTLYLVGVEDTEEGNYTCQVDDINMQLLRVFIAPKSKVLTQMFVRHLIYLGVILAMTCSCYCAGLIIAWFKRDTFKTYKQLRREARRKRRERQNLL